MKGRVILFDSGVEDIGQPGVFLTYITFNILSGISELQLLQYGTVERTQ